MEGIVPHWQVDPTNGVQDLDHDHNSPCNSDLAAGDSTGLELVVQHKAGGPEYCRTEATYLCYLK